ncbi:MAG: MFS transporter, partial [Candidatus Aminicenantes bacterium]|nr:MFS transporter [Candidatus Aminicenantes bacterium]
GALLIFLSVREKTEGDRRIFKGLSFKDIGPNLRLFMLLNALFALGAFSYSFLLIYARDLGFKITFIPVLYLVFTATASLLSFPFGKLSDKIGRKRVLILGFLLWAAVCLGAIFIHRLILLPALFILYGAHKAALEPVQRTLVCELSPMAFRASCLGGFQMLIGLCALPASLIAGWLWEQAGPSAPFALSLALTAASTLLLAFVKE